MYGRVTTLPHDERRTFVSIQYAGKRGHAMNLMAPCRGKRMTMTNTLKILEWTEGSTRSERRGKAVSRYCTRFAGYKSCFVNRFMSYNVSDTTPGGASPKTRPPATCYHRPAKQRFPGKTFESSYESDEDCFRPFFTDAVPLDIYRISKGDFTIARTHFKVSNLYSPVDSHEKIRHLAAVVRGDFAWEGSHDV